MKGCPVARQLISQKVRGACGSGRKGAGKVKRQPAKKEGRTAGRKRDSQGISPGAGKERRQEGSRGGSRSEKGPASPGIRKAANAPGRKAESRYKARQYNEEKRLKKRVFCWKGWCTVDVWVVFGEYL